MAAPIFLVLFVWVSAAPGAHVTSKSPHPDVDLCQGSNYRTTRLGWADWVETEKSMFFFAPKHVIPGNGKSAIGSRVVREGLILTFGKAINRCRIAPRKPKLGGQVPLLSTNIHMGVGSAPAIAPARR